MGERADGARVVQQERQGVVRGGVRDLDPAGQSTGSRWTQSARRACTVVAMRSVTVSVASGTRSLPFPSTVYETRPRTCAPHRRRLPAFDRRAQPVGRHRGEQAPPPVRGHGRERADTEDRQQGLARHAQIERVPPDVPTHSSPSYAPSHRPGSKAGSSELPDQAPAYAGGPHRAR